LLAGDDILRGVQLGLGEQELKRVGEETQLPFRLTKWKPNCSGPSVATITSTTRYIVTFPKVEVIVGGYRLFCWIDRYSTHMAGRGLL
jgi:hypothetical protein